MTAGRHQVVGIDHVQLAMPPGPEAEAEAEAFYAELLGLPRVAKPPELARRGGCWFELGGAKVHLGVEEDFRPARKAHPALVVTGLEALCQHLEDSGYPTRHAEDVPGRPQWYVDDPFGNRIELIHAQPADLLRSTDSTG
ncbi:MAG TPA: VOC family protein [Acidimicrobiales bacterium]|nr:VOC family protein [Acidimicrobiales bacterium]